MSTIRSPLETSLLQTAQAQQTASKVRDREKRVSDPRGRGEDTVDLTITGVETADAVRPIPQNDSEEAGAEHEAQIPPEQRSQRDDSGGPQVDVQA